MRETSANQEGLNDSPSHRQSLSDTVSFVHFSAIYLSFKNIFEEKKTKLSMIVLSENSILKEIIATIRSF